MTQNFRRNSFQLLETSLHPTVHLRYAVHPHEAPPSNNK